MTALAWFRRDLRLHDNPALAAAVARGAAVVPVFCLDDRLLHGRHASGPRTQFLLECLEDLDRSLQARGSRLVVLRGPPERELSRLATATGATEIHFAADVSTYARARGRRVAAALADAGIQLCGHPGVAVVDRPGELRTQKGKPQTVFSPFYRAWLEAPRRDVLPAPRELPAPPEEAPATGVPALADLGLEQEVAEPMRGGEGPARERLEAFVAGPLADYAEGHERLDRDGTSRLSPYLHFGCVSPRELESSLEGAGAEPFRRQLCWRDFYAQLLLHHPANTTLEFRERYRDAIEWNDSDDDFGAWCEGRTGYPLVDAGMRQLRHEGWMHNRARLVVGSFLTKYLGIDWRRGERWFMRLLLDGDQANNNGNWQWIASVGVDPQPVFRRIYNPALHMERHDPDGVYVRRHVPELRDVPDEHLREPWTMPDDVQREAGCVIGRDYPHPMVDRREARRHALERYDV